jgi:hypothetical protein
MSKITTLDCKKFLVDEITKNPDIVNRIDEFPEYILEVLSKDIFVRTLKFKASGNHEYATNDYRLWGGNTMSAQDLSAVRVFQFNPEEFDNKVGFMVLEDLQGNLILGDYFKETYYYQIGDNNGDDYVLVVSKQFWEENGHLDDCHQGTGIMPTGFYEMCESMFEYEGNMDAARQALNAAGFIEKQLFPVEE